MSTLQILCARLVYTALNLDSKGGSFWEIVNHGFKGMIDLGILILRLESIELIHVILVFTLYDKKYLLECSNCTLLNRQRKYGVLL